MGVICTVEVATLGWSSWGVAILGLTCTMEVTTLGWSSCPGLPSWLPTSVAAILVWQPSGEGVVNPALGEVSDGGRCHAVLSCSHRAEH